MCSKNFRRRKNFSVTFKKTLFPIFAAMVASLMIPTSNFTNGTATYLGYYIKSLIKFGKVFQTVQLFECKNLLILILRKFSRFTLVQYSFLCLHQIFTQVVYLQDRSPNINLLMSHNPTLVITVMILVENYVYIFNFFQVLHISLIEPILVYR